MKHENDNQWLDPLLERHIHREPEEFDFEKWAEKHPEEARLLRCGFEGSNQRTKTKPFEIWRFIMESKVTKYSAVAAIILAMTFVLFGPSWAPGNGGVVLADVQQKIAEIDTMILRGQEILTHPGEGGEVIELNGTKCIFDVVKYFSRENGFTEEAYAEGKLFYRLTFNLPKQQTLIVFPPYKRYLMFTSLDGVAKVREKLTTPNGAFNLLIESDHKKLGKDRIDGVEVVVFEFKNVKNIYNLVPKPVCDIQDFRGKVWIGVEEKLPIRIEGNARIGKSFMSMFNDLDMREVIVLDKVNIKIDDDIFDIATPEGFAEVTLIDVLQIISGKIPPS